MEDANPTVAEDMQVKRELADELVRRVKEVTDEKSLEEAIEIVTQMVSNELIERPSEGQSKLSDTQIQIILEEAEKKGAVPVNGSIIVLIANRDTFLRIDLIYDATVTTPSKMRSQRETLLGLIQVPTGQKCWNAQTWIEQHRTQKKIKKEEELPEI